MEYLNQNALEHLSSEIFQARQPYPWTGIENSLTPEGFETLRLNLPDVARFNKMVGVKRAYGQGPHDRFLLDPFGGMVLGRAFAQIDVVGLEADIARHRQAGGRAHLLGAGGKARETEDRADKACVDEARARLAAQDEKKSFRAKRPNCHNVVFHS